MLRHLKQSGTTVKRLCSFGCGGVFLCLICLIACMESRPKQKGGSYVQEDEVGHSGGAG